MPDPLSSRGLNFGEGCTVLEAFQNYRTEIDHSSAKTKVCFEASVNDCLRTVTKFIEQCRVDFLRTSAHRPHLGGAIVWTQFGLRTYTPKKRSGLSSNEQNPTGKGNC